MKKTILIGLLALTMALAVACADNNVAPSPSPAATVAPVTPAATPSPAAVSPDVASPAPTDAAGAGGNVANGNGAGADGKIEGFEEGKTVKEADLPEKVAAAIKEAYKDVKIKTISFATYLNDQMYHVVLEEPAGNDKTEQFYVKADGTIVPYEATAGAGTQSGGKS